MGEEEGEGVSWIEGGGRTVALSQWFLYTEKIECVNKDETSGGGG